MANFRTMRRLPTPRCLAQPLDRGKPTRLMVSSRALALRSSLLAPLLAACMLACVPPPKGEEGASTGEPESSSEPKRKATIPADGWNDDIAWRGFDEGLSEAKQDQRPVMMVVHTSWCPKCRSLQKVFNEDPQIERLSEQFVMVHVDQDQNPAATLYAPDGQYIPRVMFLDPNGKLDPELRNQGRPNKFRYFYTPQEDLVSTMREALDRHGNQS
jgi:protein-disulfide reductase (glutathione)